MRGSQSDELVETVDGPSSSEYPDHQPNEKYRRDDDLASVTTETSQTVRAEMII